MRDAVIVEAIRTPVGRRNGAYAGIHAVELGAHVLKSLSERVGFDPTIVEDVVWGCVEPIGEQAHNVARNAVLAAGWPESVPGTTLDRQCGSGQQAVHFAAASVMAGHYDVVVAGGSESMTRVPMESSSGAAVGVGEPFGPSMSKRYPGQDWNQGISAEMIAAKWNMSRQEVDEFAYQSHAKAASAVDSGAFQRQYVEVPDTGLTADEGIRRDTSLEKLATLRTAFKEDGVITAGNSSQISDGAGAVLITTSEIAAKNGWKPLVRLHSFAVAAEDPVIMLTGPIPATAKILKKSGLSISDIGAFEINEAFASIPLAWQKETGADLKALNPLGGAIAAGHPLGGSGLVLMNRLVHHMVDNGIKYGLQSMCEGGGMANATLVELL